MCSFPSGQWELRVLFHQDLSWEGYVDSGRLGYKRNHQTVLLLHPQIIFVCSLLLFECRISEACEH